jgi:hypothetical protein
MDVVLRAVIIYVVVFGFTRVLGRRELSSLQPFDLILLIVIGDLIQSGVTQNDLSVTGVIMVLCTHRHPAGADVIPGISLPPDAPDPAGRADRAGRKRQAHRAQHAPRTAHPRRPGGESPAERDRPIEDIRWAVLETNGDISFIKQPDG